jgi:aminotransferase in exopolysaccharide biosynthesis
MFEETIQFIKSQFGTSDFIPLHEPRFNGREKEYLLDCIDSTYVSSVGAYVDRFEAMLADYTGADFAIATVNGTSGIHTALRLAGVESGDEVITQPLTFIATANAISYCGATPCFVDVDRDTMGLSADALRDFLVEQATFDADSDRLVNKQTGRAITACLPMHTFGHPCRIDEIVSICREYGLPVIEDAAESLGSRFQSKHTGTFGDMGVFSFNGNKTITCGGGGAIITNDPELAKRAKHITTTAKIPHRWDFVHDEIAYNYRMPNLNAALACAQLEQLDEFLISQRKLAETYAAYFDTQEPTFITEPVNSRSNYWLNALILKDRQERDAFLEATNNANVMTRPIWRLMNKLEMYQHAPHGPLKNSEWLEERVVNIPSSVRPV